MQMIPRFFRLFGGVGVAFALGTGCGARSDQVASTGVADAPRDTAMIDSIPTCAGCSLAIVDSVRIGATTDKLIPVRPPEFLRDSRGQFYLMFNYWSDQPVLRYDSTGKYQGRVGASGRGPGEYEMSTAVLLDQADSLYVFEIGGLIGHCFDPDGKYVRRADVKNSLPFAINGVSRKRTLGMRRETYPPKDSPQHVIRFDQDGAIADSFAVFAPLTGWTRTVSAGKNQFAIPVRLRTSAYAAPDGSVWTLAQTNYRLEQHDSTGIPRKLFGVRVVGEPAPIMSVEEMALAKQNGRLVAEYSSVRSDKTARTLRPQNWIDIDSTGLLWIGRQIPAPSWDTISPKQQLNPNSEAPSEENLSMDIKDRLYHTIIEVIDPRAGQFLTRLTLPFLAQRVSAGFVGRVTANEDGYLLPSVYHLQLKRP